MPNFETSRLQTSAASISGHQRISPPPPRRKERASEARRQGGRRPPKNNETATSDALTFYPAYCFKASPTWFAWTKLTAWQIHHRLKPRANFHLPPEYDNSGRARDTPLLLFYLNHPIQFVQIVGVIVNFEEYFEKFWLFMIDDSSGSTIDVTCRKPETSATTFNKEHDETHSKTNAENELDAQLKELHALLSSPKVGIGTVVVAKGTLTSFRDTRQLKLERLAILPTTTDETTAISSRTSFYHRILSKAWQLDEATEERLRREAQGEAEDGSERHKRRRMRDKRRQTREERHAKQIQEEYERQEQKRVEAAERARSAGELLRKRRLEDTELSLSPEREAAAGGSVHVLDEGLSLLRDAFGRK